MAAILCCAVLYSIPCPPSDRPLKGESRDKPLPSSLSLLSPLSLPPFPPLSTLSPYGGSGKHRGEERRERENENGDDNDDGSEKLRLPPFSLVVPQRRVGLVVG